MNVLIGDTNGNKAVNASDIGQTKPQSGQAVKATNFREDANANGSINASDVNLVKSRAAQRCPKEKLTGHLLLRAEHNQFRPNEKS